MIDNDLIFCLECFHESELRRRIDSKSKKTKSVSPNPSESYGGEGL